MLQLKTDYYIKFYYKVKFLKKKKTFKFLDLIYHFPFKVAPFYNVQESKTLTFLQNFTGNSNLHPKNLLGNLGEETHKWISLFKNKLLLHLGAIATSILLLSKKCCKCDYKLISFMIFLFLCFNFKYVYNMYLQYLISLFYRYG